MLHLGEEDRQLAGTGPVQERAGNYSTVLLLKQLVQLDSGVAICSTNIRATLWSQLLRNIVASHETFSKCETGAFCQRGGAAAFYFGWGPPRQGQDKARGGSTKKCDCSRRLEAKHRRPQRASGDGRDRDWGSDTPAEGLASSPQSPQRPHLTGAALWRRGKGTTLEPCSRTSEPRPMGPPLHQNPRRPLGPRKPRRRPTQKLVLIPPQAPPCAGVRDSQPDRQTGQTYLLPTYLPTLDLSISNSIYKVLQAAATTTSSSVRPPAAPPPNSLQHHRGFNPSDLHYLAVVGCALCTTGPPGNGAASL